MLLFQNVYVKSSQSPINVLVPEHIGEQQMNQQEDFTVELIRTKCKARKRKIDGFQGKISNKSRQSMWGLMSHKPGFLSLLMAM